MEHGAFYYPDVGGSFRFRVFEGSRRDAEKAMKEYGLRHGFDFIEAPTLGRWERHGTRWYQTTEYYEY